MRVFCVFVLHLEFAYYTAIELSRCKGKKCREQARQQQQPQQNSQQKRDQPYTVIHRDAVGSCWVRTLCSTTVKCDLVLKLRVTHGYRADGWWTSTGRMEFATPFMPHTYLTLPQTGWRLPLECIFERWISEETKLSRCNNVEYSVVFVCTRITA